MEDSSFLIPHIKKCIEKIEPLVQKIGGIQIIQWLFSKYLDEAYDNSLDRYIIHRNKTSFGKIFNANSIPIPYKYLIQILLKYLGSSFIQLQSLTINKREQMFFNLIQISTKYIILQQI